MTNQMVSSCKSYLTDDGLNRVWDQDHVLVMKKIRDCLTLNRSYQDAYDRIQKQLQETPGEKPFDFSRMYIFGKFEAFCRRIDKVVEVFV
jgi:dynein heavy chain, axonemal